MPPEFISALRLILAKPTLHARFLNTLSYLEYVGFRKIVKSHLADNISVATLRHAQEESRHALLLKKLALKVNETAVPNYRPENTLAGRAAAHYFQSLDREIHLLHPADPHRTYECVTFAIEQRALALYEAYLAQNPEERIAAAIRGLVREERAHLAHVEGVAGNSLSLIEKRLFAEFTRALLAELAAHDQSGANAC